MCVLDCFIYSSTMVMATLAAAPADRRTVSRTDLVYRYGSSILGIATCSIVLATAPAGAAPVTSLLSLPGAARVESMREG